MIAVKVAAFALWAAAYAMFLGVFAYLIAFLANRYAFSTIDSGLQIPTAEAAWINGKLLVLFALQHSLMARGWFKNRLPLALSRTAYLLATDFVLITIFRRWEPMPEIVWRIENGWWMWAIFCAGWLLVAWASFVCDHWGKFGLRHVVAFWRSESLPEAPLRFPGPYRVVRHPMMAGLLLGFWATPEMTYGHLLFAAAMTVYVVAGILFEERDLVRRYGDAYREYQRGVPMLMPGLGRRRE